LYTKSLEYKEYFTHIAVPQITKSSREIQDLVDMKFRILGQAVSKIYDCFGLYNVLTALDPPFERLFCEDYNGGFYLKGG
jgi:hypothetical protein